MSEDDAQIYDQEDEYGRFLIRPLRRTGGEDRREDRPTMFYPVTAPDGTLVYPKGPTGYDSRWICGEPKYKELVKNHLIAWKKVEQNGNIRWNVYQKF
jgi:adenine-specific DNA-methyltransferase